MKRTRGAFTLVELLVVIAIIALLLSILMPSLNKARQLAQAAICQTNLHDTSLVLFLYTQDNRDRLTPDWNSYSYFAANDTSLTVDMSSVMWHYLAQDYWKNPKILFCPIAKKVASINGSTPFLSGGFKEWGHTNWAWYTPWAPPLKATGKPAMSSYGVNDFACTPFRSDPLQQREADKMYFSTIMQKGASKIPMTFDSAWYAITPSDTSLLNPNPLDKYHYPFSFGPATLPRHNDGINMVFLDGSLRRIGIKELWTLKWSKIFDTANRCTSPEYTWSTSPWVHKLRK